jgi:hypothetical protein
MTKRISLIWVLLCGALAGMAQAQTITATYTFTASGYIGTPATATTPFQGQVFTSTVLAMGYDKFFRSVTDYEWQLFRGDAD